MRNGKCPSHRSCWDYKNGSCETCDLGKEILKLHRRIERLEKQKKKYEKIIAMFRPASCDFLEFKAEEVIEGPNDRAFIGFDTSFPIKWLVEDYDFTKEEARWFVSEVQRLHAKKKKVQP